MESFLGFLSLFFIVPLIIHIVTKGYWPHSIAGFYIKYLVNCFKILWWFIKFLVNGIQQKQTIFGSAKFLERKERNILLSSKNEGIFIEGDKRLTKEKSFEHSLILASTGSGKTTRFCMVNLLGICKDNTKKLPSLVITDPTNEIWENSAGYLSSIGYELKRLDFENPNFSFGYNPLGKIRKVTEVDKIADILVRSAYPQQSADSSFWNDMAKQIISLLCRCLLHESIEPKYRNLHNVRFLLNSFGKNGSPLNDFFGETADEMTFQEIMGFIANDEKVLLGAIASAKSALRLFTNENICKVTATSSLEYEDLRKKPVVLFVSIPEHEQKLYQPLLSMFYTELFGFFMQMPKEGESYQNIFTYLEEGLNLYIPDCSGFVTTLRKRKVSLNFVGQNLSQFIHRYGKAEASTILGNLNTKIYFPGLDIETCEKLERTLGKTTQKYSEPSPNSYETNQDPNERFTGRPLMMADEIRTMPYPLLIQGSKRPVVLKNMLPFYKIPKMIQRSQIPAPSFSSSTGDGVSYLDLSAFQHDFIEDDDEI